jgi:hypothetical protein
VTDIERLRVNAGHIKDVTDQPERAPRLCATPARRNLDGRETDADLKTLERNATWLTQIVEDVLDVSRIVSGKIRIDLQSTELPLTIDKPVASLEPGATAKGRANSNYRRPRSTNPSIRHSRRRA